MQLIKAADGTPEPAARHFLETGVQKIAPSNGTARTTCTVSHFLPGGGAEMTSSAAERVYYGLSGTVLVTGADGSAYAVGPGDTLYIPPGEERKIDVPGTEPATIVVIIVKVAD